MKYLFRRLNLLALLLGLFAVVNGQNLKADYQLQGNLDSSVLGAPALTHLTGSAPNTFENDLVDGYIRQTLRFPFNSGVALFNTNAIIPNNTYTIVGLFKLDNLSSYRRLIDFKNGSSQSGAYMLDGRFEGEPTTNPAEGPGLYFQAVIVREATGRVRAYRDGFLRVDIPNDGGINQIDASNVLRFFQDDFVSGGQASAGNAVRLRLYDGPMTTTQVRALDRLPNATGGGQQPILFGSGRNGFFEIYTMNPDGSNQKRLTNNEVTEVGAKWSPNRQRIIYARRETNASPYQIWIMNADGTGQTRLTNAATNDQNPEWRRDGAKILFSRCDSNFLCDLFTMNSDGSGQESLLPANTSGDEDEATYSADGTKIIFVCSSPAFSNANICTANSDGNNRHQLTTTVSPVANLEPRYSPDGTKVVFTRQFDEANTATREVFSINADGGLVTNLTNNSVLDYSPVWSADGSRIGFTSLRNVISEVYTMNANGSAVQRLTFNSIGESIYDWYRPPLSRSPFDFDGDGKTDIGIFRPLSSAEWWINRSSTGVTLALQFGASTDKIAPADYTGDGKADIAFFRPSSGQWFVLRSEDFSFFALPFGTNGDVPVPADYDADGKADFAVFRPSSSTWFISQSAGAPTRIEGFGIVGDAPIVADYDGDGKADIGIFRPAAGGGEWWIQRSTAGLIAMQFGASTDKAVQGDYTGDGKADVAIWRPSTGEWFIVRSEDFSFYGFPFGANGDVPSPGDYDGDGKFDATVFRPSNATWFIARSTAGTQIVQFGANGDRPIPSSFVVP